MRELHIHPDLLGSTISNASGCKAKVMAIWLEDQSIPGEHPTQLIAFVQDAHGRSFRLKLSDKDWESFNHGLPALPAHEEDSNGLR